MSCSQDAGCSLPIAHAVVRAKLLGQKKDQQVYTNLAALGDTNGYFQFVQDLGVRLRPGGLWKFLSPYAKALAHPSSKDSENPL